MSRVNSQRNSYFNYGRSLTIEYICPYGAPSDENMIERKGK